MVDVYKSCHVMCKVDTGFDSDNFLIATFYKKDAAHDYCSYLQDMYADNLYVTYYVEEDELYEKK